MTTSKELVREPSITDDDKEQYHHHSREIKNFEDYDREYVTALCGYVKKPHPNPLSLPCCPECQKLAKNQCPSREWQ